MKPRCLLVAALIAVPPAARAQDGARKEERKARNVILFLADAGGIPTLHAASLHGHGEPRKLFVQNMHHIALAETSSASRWVTDSAAGMTAIVTGHKTHNGVLAQSSAAVKGKKDGAPLKTILEYAEEQGLATGVVSNSAMDSATPAALYAHVNDRGRRDKIFVQVLSPRFGDGVDVVIGPGRKEIYGAARKAGVELGAALEKRGYTVRESLATTPTDRNRVVALFDDNDFDLGDAVAKAIAVLARNKKGYFLMVESDLHAKPPLRAVERAVAFDRIIRRVTEQSRAEGDTLVLFTADHSYDFRVIDGKRGRPLVPGAEDGVVAQLKSLVDGDSDNFRVDDDHTGEEVLVAAEGPGAGAVRGFLSNTDLFHIMMAAFGWQAPVATTRP
jgi:alkaline phosphatase